VIREIMTDITKHGEILRLRAKWNETDDRPLLCLALAGIYLHCCFLSLHYPDPSYLKTRLHGGRCEANSSWPMRMHRQYSTHRGPLLLSTRRTSSMIGTQLRRQASSNVMTQHHEQRHPTTLLLPNPPHLSLILLRSLSPSEPTPFPPPSQDPPSTL
jgi:hypothetical protein